MITLINILTSQLKEIHRWSFHSGARSLGCVFAFLCGAHISLRGILIVLRLQHGLRCWILVVGLLTPKTHLMSISPGLSDQLQRTLLVQLLMAALSQIL